MKKKEELFDQFDCERKKKFRSIVLWVFLCIFLVVLFWYLSCCERRELIGSIMLIILMVDPIILLLGIIYQIQELDVASCISTVDWSLRFNIEYKQELDAKKQIVEPLMIEQSGSFRVYTQDQVQCWQELAVKFMKTDSDDIWLNLQNEIQ